MSSLQFWKYWEYHVITITNKFAITRKVSSAWHATTDGESPVQEILEVPRFYH